MTTNEDGPVQRRPGEKEMTREGKLTLGLLLLALGFVLLYLIVTLWPAVEAANTGKAGHVTWFWRDFSLTADATLLILVVLVSALGSYIHISVSFSDFAGNRQLVASWMWWYVLRVFVGSALAVLFYFAIPAGSSPPPPTAARSTSTASPRSRDSSGCSPSRRRTSCARSSTRRSGPSRGKATTRARTAWTQRPRSGSPGPEDAGTRAPRTLRGWPPPTPSNRRTRSSSSSATGSCSSRWWCCSWSGHRPERPVGGGRDHGAEREHARAGVASG